MSNRFTDHFMGIAKGHAGTHQAGDAAFAAGDRVSVLLDLDEGWMRFYQNGKRRGDGFTGVTGPLVRAAQLYRKGDIVTVLT